MSEARNLKNVQNAVAEARDHLAHATASMGRAALDIESLLRAREAEAGRSVSAVPAASPLDFVTLALKLGTALRFMYWSRGDDVNSHDRFAIPVSMPDPGTGATYFTAWDLAPREGGAPDWRTFSFGRMSNIELMRDPRPRQDLEEYVP